MPPRAEQRSCHTGEDHENETEDSCLDWILSSPCEQDVARFGVTDSIYGTGI